MAPIATVAKLFDALLEIMSLPVAANVATSDCRPTAHRLCHRLSAVTVEVVTYRDAPSTMAFVSLSVTSLPALIVDRRKVVRFVDRYVFAVAENVQT